ncbi:CpsD/CapB family tyrosine-protein kinase [Sphingopyxis fribergensis]
MRAEAETGKIVSIAPSINGDATTADHMLDPELLRRNLVVGFESTDSEDVHPFSVLRSQLLKHVRATGSRVFAIMSVQPGNGKTHVAVNLAAALSRIHPTVLVELDLRRPSLGQALGLSPIRPGIDDTLAETATLQEFGMRIDGTKLTVHRVRTSKANPEALLSSDKLTELTNAIRNSDDQPICIIDTPPAVIHDDIMLIAPAVDGIIMVVQEARTSKRALVNTIKSLSPTPVIGTVLNRSISSPLQTAEYEYYYNTMSEPGSS